ncbi:N-acetylmuramoyl-L-alanine amidase [Deinococcus metalli]|uniref:N-acetylmuramoyl-L-alanine amidase n=1 Tax=Deinococcus metalli TaxID=1141878 RepID=A0A7W8KC96_9DEIO|nr:N-acetylmuramoyl-L-alanine amidase [Deinococcus metalli]MBB5375535.1 N-acetylmuramoyl-L-alanine amidase [Deinococcus metalli]GHF28544.1 N-acetylmuramoyl-L-alanine amidase [Deinococcus metalli]
MPKRLLAALLCSAAPALMAGTTAAPSGAPDVFVAYPDAGASVAFDHVILEGSVSPGGDLRIDGKRVPVGPDGLFMEWWPLRPGVNDLRLVTTRAGRTGTLTWRVTRTATRTLPARPTAVEGGSVRPGVQQVYWDAVNDTPAERAVTVSFRGSPGGRAAYRLAGSPPVPMTEGPAGTYSAVYTLPTTARLLDAVFTVTLTGPDGRTATATAPGHLTSTPAGPRTATQRPGTVRGLALNESGMRLTDLAGAALLYPREGMTFTAVGRVGDDLRVRLAPGVPALVTADQVEVGPGRTATAPGGPLTLDGALAGPVGSALPLLAQASPPAPSDVAGVPPELSPVPGLVPPPAAPTGDLRVRVPLGGVRLPHTLEQRSGGSQLVLTLYGPFAAPLTAPDGMADPLLRGVDVQPGLPGVTVLTLDLAPGQAWGFQAGYDGADLVVTVRRPPAVDPVRPLAGRVIVLDPGHGGSQKGGAGSLRTPEKGLVLPIAMRAAALLRAQGATVILTRTSDVTLGLYERGLIAEGARAELLVSVHANALPDGRDPRGVRGPEVYFSHPQSQAVAASILAALRRTLPDLGPGQGLMGGADLALTRPSAQPSVLVETAYLTDAGNLRALQSPAGQERFAQAIAAGIAQYFAALAR